MSGRSIAPCRRLPFRSAENVPAGNSCWEQRALNDPRPAKKLLPIEYLPAQLDNMTRLQRYSAVNPEDVSVTRPAVDVGSGWNGMYADIEYVSQNVPFGSSLDQNIGSLLRNKKTIFRQHLGKQSLRDMGEQAIRHR
jgi:hypothetical protein